MVLIILIIARYFKKYKQNKFTNFCFYYVEQNFRDFIGYASLCTPQIKIPDKSRRYAQWVRLPKSVISLRREIKYG